MAWLKSHCTSFIDVHAIWSPTDPRLFGFCDNTEYGRTGILTCPEGQLLATVTEVGGHDAIYSVCCHHRLLEVEGALDTGVTVSATPCVLASLFIRCAIYAYVGLLQVLFWVDGKFTSPRRGLRRGRR